jgi:hypothetical protein
MSRADRQRVAPPPQKDSDEDALAELLPHIRSALHAAGCATARWPEFVPKDPVIRELQGT